MDFDQEIWVAARTLIDRHGNLAWVEATIQADRLLAAGDVDGAERMVDVLRAIEWLQGHSSEPSKLVH
jgi:hypothetical protein